MALTTESLCRFQSPPWLRINSPFFACIPFAVIGLALSFLAGCGTDGTVDPLADVAQAKGTNGGQNATITVSPIKITFSATQNAGTTPQQAVAVSKSGPGKLSWTVNTDVSWLSIAPASGTGAGSFTVTAMVPGLAAGSYSANITVAASQGTTAPQIIPVSLTISAPTLTSAVSTTTMSITPTSVELIGTQGGSNPSAAVALSNIGSGILGWTVTSDLPWLLLDPPSGIAPSSFTATANLTGLAAGTYSGAITVTETGASNSPQTIPVNLTIAASQPITTSTQLLWNPDPDPTVVGFFVHYGTQSAGSSGSCSYGQGLYIPMSSLTASSPSATVTNLATGTTYYFAVSAYNGKIESSCSNEVSKAT